MAQSQFQPKSYILDHAFIVSIPDWKPLDKVVIEDKEKMTTRTMTKETYVDEILISGADSEKMGKLYKSGSPQANMANLKAFNNYLEAVKLGSLIACGYLATLLLKNRVPVGVLSPKSLLPFMLAFELLQKSAQSGYLRSIENLALMYANGDACKALDTNPADQATRVANISSAMSILGVIKRNDLFKKLSGKDKTAIESVILKAISKRINMAHGKALDNVLGEEEIYSYLASQVKLLSDSNIEKTVEADASFSYASTRVGDKLDPNTTTQTHKI